MSVYVCIQLPIHVFFSPLATFFSIPFGCIFIFPSDWPSHSRPSITTESLINERKRRKYITHFYEESTNAKGKKSVKRKIEGSTSPHPSNKHVTNTYIK